MFNEKEKKSEFVHDLTEEQRSAYEIFTRGCEEVLSPQELMNKIKTGKPLIVKAGFDPTAPDIHLGHTVIFRKMRHFQRLGHHIKFLIGDFTGMIGDPTGKSKTRKQLTSDEVLKNAETYKKQVFKILDEEKTDVVFNSSWLSGMRFEDVLHLTARYPVARMLERDDFSKRYKSGQSISMVEMMYPLIQGYDSVALKSDIELGGTDQKFNLLVGRNLMREWGMEPQVCMTLPILEGLDGVNKMSKSLGNYIGIFDKPSDMYGKVMSIGDHIIFRYFRLLTDVPEEILEDYQKHIDEGKNPKDIKVKLALEIVKEYHNGDVAEEARREFEKVFASKGLPDDIPEVEMAGEEIWIIDFLKKTGHAASNGEYRRLIQNRAVSINQEKITDVQLRLTPEDGSIVKIGKRGFYKILVTS